MDTEPARQATRYRVLDLVVDTGARRVTRQGEPLPIGGLTFDLLDALIDAAPNIASFEQISKAVWKGRPVSPETITQRAKMLREALGDDARSPRYFEPVRGQGYRLCVEADAVRASTRPGRRLIVLAACLAVAAVAVIAAFRPDRAEPAGQSVAVLPLADLSPDQDQRYLADGIAEELINVLADLQGLDVASRTSSFAFSGTTQDARTIGEALNVTAILEGSVRRFGDEIRINVQLIDVETGFYLWSQAYERAFTDVLLVQNDIAAAVAGALGVELGVGGVNEFVGAGTRNFEAYEAYLNGDFRRAIELDPAYAAAWARRGIEIASTMWTNMPQDAPGIIREAYEHVAKAIELDPESSRAQNEFATLIYVTLDWGRAEQAFQSALARRRDDRNRSHYSNMLMRAGRLSAAASIRAEIEGPFDVRNDGPVPNTDPAIPLIDRFSIHLSIARGDYDLARQLNQRSGDASPFRRRQNALALALNERSMPAIRDAVAALADFSATYADIFGPLIDRLDSADAALAYLQSLAGSAEHVWPDKYHDIALLAAYFGDPEFAFEVFSEELVHTTIRFFALWYPVMAEVRQLPEFRDFISSVNLDTYWRAYGWADQCRPIGSESFACN